VEVRQSEGGVASGRGLTPAVRMERKLKFHERKLLKKHSFIEWRRERHSHEIAVIRRYGIQNREDYTKYNKICLMIKRLAHILSELDPKDPFRIKMTDQLLEKLYNMGLLPFKKSLAQCAEITASAFCRRRLPVVLVRNKYCETLKEAITFVEQGHIRIGPEVVTDPAFLVTRTMEDFITWVDSSKIRRKVLAYHNMLDDYDFL
jgi:U3 small nucleolar ribonucleoprotein protein IMP3